MPDSSLLPLRFARLRAQHLTDDTRLDGDVASVTRAIVALQAQDFGAARHQVRVRSAGLTARDVDRAFAESRTVVRTWLMRGTLHLCAADDYRWLLDVFGPAVDKIDANRRVNLGLDDATCARGVGVLRKVLAHGPMARRHIRDRLVSAGVLKEPVGQTLIHLLFHAAALGVTCCGPRMGRDDSFVLADDWFPTSDGPRGDAALAELARRYFGAYGPAGEADFAAWSGLRMTVVRPAMAAVAGELVEFPEGPPGLWTLGPVSTAPISRPAVRLLGHFDTFLLGYRRREHVGDVIAEEWIHDGGGGWIRPVVCLDGWIVGGWRLEQERSGVEVRITPFARIPARAEPGISREVAAIGRFLEQPARWSSGPLVG